MAEGNDGAAASGDGPPVALSSVVNKDRDADHDATTNGGGAGDAVADDGHGAARALLVRVGEAYGHTFDVFDEIGQKCKEASEQLEAADKAFAAFVAAVPSTEAVEQVDSDGLLRGLLDRERELVDDLQNKIPRRAPVRMRFGESMLLYDVSTAVKVRLIEEEKQRKAESRAEVARKMDELAALLGGQTKM